MTQTLPTASSATFSLGSTRTLQHWEPEDSKLWEQSHKRIALRNLFWSIVSEHIGFSVWSIWSVMVLLMPENIYHVSSSEKFILVAMPAFVGALLRLPYSQGPRKFGGRNFTILTVLLLLIPLILTAILITHPGHSFSLYLLVSALAGLGGGNYAASMSNINAFFPQRFQGWALGINAGGGNLGVPVIELCALGMLALTPRHAALIVCLIYLCLTVFAAIGTAVYANNLPRQNMKQPGVFAPLKYRESWLIGLLYFGCFGSFIGYAFAFGQVLIISFTGHGQSTAQASLHAAEITFIGPLIGSLTRIYGGALADKKSGVKISIAAFSGMLVTAVGLTVYMALWIKHPLNLNSGNLGVMIGCFIALFAFSGVANGSVVKIIPLIFSQRSQDLTDFSAEGKRQWAQDHSGSLIGIAGAVGGLGGVAINLMLRASYNSPSHSALQAFICFGIYYLLCIGILHFGLRKFHK